MASRVQRSGHYLALAHSALTSFSLMSSQRLSCSIWRSRSLMSPIVTHIGRAAYTLWSHTPYTHAHTRTGLAERTHSLPPEPSPKPVLLSTGAKSNWWSEKMETVELRRKIGQIRFVKFTNFKRQKKENTDCIIVILVSLGPELLSDWRCFSPDETITNLLGP